MSRNRHGVVLLEVIIALTLLAVAGLSMTVLASAGWSVQRRTHNAEREMRNADRVLSAYALLGRHDLDIRLGRRDVGDFVVGVQRPEPTLYRIAVAAEDAANVELLVTVVYRP